MSDKPTEKNHKKETGSRKEEALKVEARKNRLTQALRQNLRRRKSKSDI
jgi:hypothetical protein